MLNERLPSNYTHIYTIYKYIYTYIYIHTGWNDKIVALEKTI